MLAVAVAVAVALAGSPAPPPGLRHLPEPHTDFALSAGTKSSEALLRKLVAETAAAQVDAIDPAWAEAQRDCAGLVRFAYRAAYRRLAPARVDAGLFRGDDGRPAQFADAAALLRGSFAPLGRDAAARARLAAGDVVAFSRDEDGLPVLHLMLIVRAEDPAHGPAQVVYHPGEKGAAVRAGPLASLARDAPGAWRPVPENPLFLGFYRWKEWIP
jgi:uncharacterized protein YfaT (DUF1175 family)